MGCLEKVAIIHYRAGRTDGVSLEIDKRQSILKRLGMDVSIVSGPVEKGSDFIIEALEFDTPEMVEIKENSFKHFQKNSISPDVLMEKIWKFSQQIEEQILIFHRQKQFDALLLHNIFGFALHLPAFSAFANIVRNLKIPTISTNHDYYWERPEYLEPVNSRVQKYMDTYILPNDDCITHISINSIAQEKLRELKGISSTVIPDVFDFKQDSWQRDKFNSDFLSSIGVKENDLVVLQATRIIERKGIEVAMRFVKELARKKDELAGKILYNGKRLDKTSNVVFVLAGYAEKMAEPYLDKLKEKASRIGIQAKFIGDKIGMERSSAPEKIYSLWDAYVHADLVTYPSIIEGWGNQFIEAIFAKKPVVVFEYPVFKKDIKPEGYHYISLGDRIYRQDESGLIRIPEQQLQATVNAAIETLTAPNTPQKLEENFSIGTKYHDLEVTERFLRKKLCKDG